MKKTLMAFLVVLLLIFPQIESFSALEDNQNDILLYADLPDMTYQNASGGVAEITATFLGIEDYDLSVRSFQIFSIGGEKYYNFLNVSQQQAYTAIKNAADIINTGVQINMPAGLTVEAVYECYQALLNDNPQYFWLYKGYYYYLNSSQTYVTSVLIYSYYYTTPYQPGVVFGVADKARIAQVQNSIDVNMAVFLQNCAGKTDAQKSRIIHDNLTNAIEYDLAALDTQVHTAHSITGVFLDKTAVCEGYARAYQYLLNLQGIDCYYLTGYAGGGLHAWNLVKINGIWYETDTTWDDPISTTPILRYDYFNITTDMIRTDHMRDSSFINQLPIAFVIKTDTDYSWSGAVDFIIDGTTLVEYIGVGGNVTVPDNIKKLGNYSFQIKVCAVHVKLPKGLTEIEGYAFASNRNLQIVELPSSVTSIYSLAFSNSPNITIKGYTNTYASTFAQNNSISFIEKTLTENVTAKITSYNPQNPITIQLLQDGIVKYTTTIESSTGSGRIEQSFSFVNIDVGVYTMEITKETHIKYIINNLYINYEDMDLQNDAREGVRSIVLACGDINGDGNINATDLNILWSNANYLKKTNEASNSRADLTGSGEINATDLNILWSAQNYLKGTIIIN